MNETNEESDSDDDVIGGDISLALEESFRKLEKNPETPLAAVDAGDPEERPQLNPADPADPDPTSAAPIGNLPGDLPVGNRASLNSVIGSQWVKSEFGCL